MLSTLHALIRHIPHPTVYSVGTVFVIQQPTFADCLSSERAPVPPSNPPWEGVAWWGATQHGGGQGDSPTPCCGWARPCSWHGGRWEGDGRSDGHELKSHHQTAAADSPWLYWWEGKAGCGRRDTSAIHCPGPAWAAPAVGWHTLIASSITAVNLPRG